MIHRNSFLLKDQLDFERTKEKDAVYVLLVLNSESVKKHMIEQLWGKVDIRVCADGGANRLFDALGGENNKELLSSYLPDFIKGDLDSIRKEDVLPFYEQHGVSVTRDHNVDTTDFEKCLDEIKCMVERDGMSNRKIILIAVGGFEGSMYHDMGNIHVLYKYCDDSVGDNNNRDTDTTISTKKCAFYHRILLMGSSCIAELLVAAEGRDGGCSNKFPVEGEEEGNGGWRGDVFTHTLYPCCYDHHHTGDSSKHYPVYIEGPTCGLYPIRTPCEHITTSGLQWNLRADRLSFGTFISTSNRLLLGPGDNSDNSDGSISPIVTVALSHTVLWVTEYHLPR